MSGKGRKKTWRGDPNTPPRRKDRPLRVSVDRDVLTIELGVDTLAFAALSSPYAWKLDGRTANHPRERFRIDDKREFALDVAHELVDEAEDGSNLITEMLDKATEEAIENGSTAFVDTREPK